MRKATLFLASLALSFSSSAQTGNLPPTGTLEHNGHIITLQYQYEHILVEDPETGKTDTRLTRSEKRDLLDGEKIYYGGEASPPIGSASQHDLQTFIQSLLAEELNFIKTKQKSVSINIIIDANGKLAFFMFDQISNAFTKREVGDLFSMQTKLEAVTFIPAQKDGKNVPYSLVVSGL